MCYYPWQKDNSMSLACPSSDAPGRSLTKLRDPRLILNDRRMPEMPFSALSSTLSGTDMDRAAQTIRGWSAYEATPLLSLAGFARMLGLASVLCKDESRRFGFGGVKALGAPYGLALMLEARRPCPPSDFEAIAATDGNHGLALAWAASRFGCRARILVGRGVDTARIGLIRAAGAQVDIIDGTYDEAVLEAEARAARDASLLLVTDTDYDGRLPVTRAIMAGYALLGEEIWREIRADAPTHIVLQCGVGGMAAGVVAGLWRRMEQLTPRIVTVEPRTAACLQTSIEAGVSIGVPGRLETRMVGLSCGRASRPAWDILRHTAFAGLAIDDGHAEHVQNDLANGAYGDVPLRTGDTGVAGLAGLAAAALSPSVRRALGLETGSRVLVINSEGPLPDPASPALRPE